jgi:DNA-binding MarR family transcriptional regulator/N-acetylglutamate synthase-like GNAT family acetyltransferase
MVDSAFDQRVAAVRRFSRFYTQRIGVLADRVYDSPFSLSEVRVLYELAHRDTTSAAELSRDLGLDPGYLSRILKAFEKRKLLERTRSTDDARRSHLSLTRRGHDAFAPVHTRARDDIAALLGRLAERDQTQLVEALETVERLLGVRPEQKAPYMLRSHQPGDMGWVVHRHGVLYAQEYGFDERFEALVATIVARFIERFDARRERCWIAEKDAEIVGSVFCVKRSPTVAQLRLMLVEPRARGLGIGARLVAECVRFARQAGYRKVTLWTNSILLAARHVYEAAGFSPVRSEKHRSFGRDLVGETWELTL